MFRARCGGIPNDIAEVMLGFVQPSPPELSWNILFDEFEELLTSKRESASGPDGTSCSVYRSAGDRTLFIPKSSEVDDQGRIIRAPDALRPLILCNRDRKVITAPMCCGP